MISSQRLPTKLSENVVFIEKHPFYKTNERISITMSRLTLLMVIALQFLMIALFFMVGFIVAWSYFDKTINEKYVEKKPQTYAELYVPEKEYHDPEDTIAKGIEKVE